MQPVPNLSDDFEEVDPASNVVPLLPNAEESTTQEQEAIKALSFDEIFKEIILGREVKLKVRLKGEYESLRVSLLRRYKNYQEIQLVLGTEREEYLATSATRIGTRQQPVGYQCGFQLRPLSEKKNADTKRYQILDTL